MIEILLSVAVGWAAFATLKWWRVADRMRIMKAWIAEEQNAERDLLDLEPTLAAELGIKRKESGRVIVENYQPRMTPQEHAAMQQQLFAQAYQTHQTQQSPQGAFGSLIGGIGGLNI